MPHGSGAAAAGPDFQGHRRAGPLDYKTKFDFEEFYRKHYGAHRGEGERAEGASRLVRAHSWRSWCSGGAEAGAGAQEPPQGAPAHLEAGGASGTYRWGCRRGTMGRRRALWPRRKDTPSWLGSSSPPWRST
jgi:hypothetical protein